VFFSFEFVLILMHASSIEIPHKYSNVILSATLCNKGNNVTITAESSSPPFLLIFSLISLTNSFTHFSATLLNFPTPTLPNAFNTSARFSCHSSSFAHVNNPFPANRLNAEYAGIFSVPPSFNIFRALSLEPTCANGHEPVKREDVAPNILLFLTRERASSSSSSSSLDVDPDPDANDHASSLPLIHPSILSTKCILPSLSSFASKSSLPLLLGLVGGVLVDTTSLKLHPIRFRRFAMVAMPFLRSDRIVSARFARKTARRATGPTTVRQKKNGTEDPR
jgi:hypothetical protein